PCAARHAPLSSSVICTRCPPPPALFPYTPLFRSARADLGPHGPHAVLGARADALRRHQVQDVVAQTVRVAVTAVNRHRRARGDRSEEHTAELQSRENLVGRLLLQKKKEHTSNPGT